MKTQTHFLPLKRRATGARKCISLLILGCLCVRQSFAQSTVTGTILTTTGAPESAPILFTPRSTPLSIPQIVASTFESVTSAVNGTFSIQLEQGNYDVTVGRTARDKFLIAVPAGTGTWPISSLIVSNLTYAFPFSPSYETLLNKNQTNGYAGLDANGYVPVSEINPSISGGGGAFVAAGTNVTAVTNGSVVTINAAPGIGIAGGVNIVMVTNGNTVTASLASNVTNLTSVTSGVINLTGSGSNNVTGPVHFGEQLNIDGAGTTASNQTFAAANVITGSLGDARYGQLGTNNTWTGNQVFQGALTNTGGVALGGGGTNYSQNFRSAYGSSGQSGRPELSIYCLTASVSSGAGATVMATNTIPGNGLANDGDAVKYEWAGGESAQQSMALFVGTNSTTFTQPIKGPWSLAVIIQRNSTTNLVVSASGINGPTASGDVFILSTVWTNNPAIAVPVGLAVTGAGITINGGVGHYIPAGP